MRLLSLLVFVAAAAATSTVASAALLTQTLGDQDFANGSTQGSALVIGAVAGDPVPFNTIIGADNSGVGPNFSASWTFSNYGGPIVSPIASATLLIASWDFDTNNTSGSQVGSFDMNGTNLATVLDAAFTADRNTANAQIKWYTITLPASTYTQLATGSATFNLALQNGAGILGNTTFNGAAMDFSTLTINTQDQVVVPEPSTIAAMAGGLIMLVALRRRRSN